MKKLLSKKKVLIIICSIICLLVVAVAGLRIYRQYNVKCWMEQRNRKGILLSFDDYNPNSWTELLDLLDEYGVKVTFFVTLAEPTDFCAEAVSRGHEIGFHTAGHVKMTEISAEEVYEQAIEPIEKFRAAGYELTSFAYPYGLYNEELNEELLQHYDTLRGAYHFQGCFKESLHKGFVEAYPLDNIYYESDEVFREKIAELLDVLANCEDGTVASVYSHAIGGGDWCITSSRLEILFEEAQKRDLEFYTFQELQ